MKRLISLAAGAALACGLLMGTSTCGKTAITANGGAVAEPAVSLSGSPRPPVAPPARRGSHPGKRNRRGQAFVSPVGDPCFGLPNGHPLAAWTARVLGTVYVDCSDLRHIQKSHPGGSGQQIMDCIHKMIEIGKVVLNLPRESVSYRVYTDSGSYGQVVVSTRGGGVITAWYPPGTGWENC
jgi:hypothetical protein